MTNLTCSEDELRPGWPIIGATNGDLGVQTLPIAAAPFASLSQPTFIVCSGQTRDGREERKTSDGRCSVLNQEITWDLSVRSFPLDSRTKTLNAQRCLLNGTPFGSLRSHHLTKEI